MLITYLRVCVAMIYLILYLASKATNSIDHQIRVLLSQICSTPLLGHFIPGCAYIKKMPPVDPDYERLMTLQQGLEPISALTTGAPSQASGSDGGGSSLSLSYEMRKSEAAVRDLAVLVKLSNLPSKEGLGRAINGFVVNAKDTARGLQRLGAKVGGAVDSVLAMDE